MQPTPLCPAHLLVADVSIWATSLLAVAVRCIFSVSFFFFLLLPGYVALWDSKTPKTCPWESFLLCGNFSSFTLSPQVRSPSLNLLSLFLSFIFCPTSFRREWAAFLGAWCTPPAFRSCFVEVAQHSDDLLMNLWERKRSPCPIPPPSWDCFPLNIFFRNLFVEIWGFKILLIE